MAAVTPATAEEYVTNFGPVGPNEPIIAALGGQRVIAFFEPDRGSCSVHTPSCGRMQARTRLTAPRASG
jgi:hypothetical protein